MDHLFMPARRSGFTETKEKKHTGPVPPGTRVLPGIPQCSAGALGSTSAPALPSPHSQRRCADDVPATS